MPIFLKPLLRLIGKRSRPARPPAPDLAAAQDVAFLSLEDFQLAACPLCGASSKARLSVYPSTPGSRMRPRIVWWCEACGSGVVPNAKGFLADYYRRDYAAEIKKDRELSPEEYFSSAARERSASIARHLGRMEHQIRTLRRIGGDFQAVLDFGSGPGYFLKALDPPRKLAVELDEASKKYLDYIGAETVELAEVPDESLDLIMASHALEHLCCEELDGVLATMARKLKVGGLLYVEVPQGSLTALQLAYKHEPHTIFFTPKGLEAAVCRSGLAIVERGYRSPGRVKRRENPVWTPDPADPFQASIGGGMTVVARRVAEISA